MTFTPPVASLNAMLENMKLGFSKYGRSKYEKIQKLREMGKDPYDKDELIRVLNDEYGKQHALIKKLRKQLVECEDILEEYESCDTHTVNDVVYHFEYHTQTLWNNREKKKKCGKFHRHLGTYTMY